MKKLLFLILLSLSFSLTFADSTPAVSKEAALQYVIKTYSTQKETTTANFYVASVQYSGSPAWCIFVDPSPLANWGHSCYWAFVPKNSTPVSATLKRGTMPPAYELEPIKINKQINDELITDPIDIQINPNINGVTDSAHTYAVIISGGIDCFRNHKRYWNDCSFIYQTLRNKFNVPKENIELLMSDGDDPAPDLIDKTSSPTDLDFDGEKDLHYAATLSNVYSVFNRLARKLKKDDHLFVFVIDHGGNGSYYVDNEYKDTSYICLWHNEDLYAPVFGSILDKFSVASINVLLGQCCSGGFIEYLEKPGRVISAACAQEESSWGFLDDQPFDAFVYYWTAAMNGIGAMGDIASADTNKNGFISALEAHNYAENGTRNKNRDPANPMYSSVTEYTGASWSFDRLPSTYNLYMRDNDSDNGLGIVRNEEFWNSPDLWCAISSTNPKDHVAPYQHPRRNIKSQVNARIHNNGWEAYIPGKSKTKYVHFYIAPACLNPSISDWKGYNGIGSAKGKWLVAIPINDTIPVGDNVIISYQFEMDKLNIEIDEFGNFKAPNRYSVLAKLSDSQSPTNLLENGMNTYDNNGAFDVALHPFIAERSFSNNPIFADGPFYEDILLRNSSNITKSYRLESYSSGGSGFKYGHMKIKLCDLFQT